MLAVVLAFAFDLASQPLTLRLELTKKGELRAFLKNQSSTGKALVHAGDLQPSRLEITSAAGKRVEPFDDRSLKKFDPTIYEYSFSQLAPGQEMALFDAKVQKLLRWGPFEYRLAPGEYRAQVVFESVVDKFYDEASKTQKPMKEAWLGTLRSDVVSLKVR